MFRSIPRLSLSQKLRHQALRPVAIGLILALAGCGPAQEQTGVAPDPASAPVATANAKDAAVSLRLARAARAAGDVTGAIQLYRSAAESGPEFAQAFVELGDTLAGTGMLDDAIETYGRVEPASPAGTAALLGLVRAYYELGDAARALEFADKALAQAPREARVQLDRGAVLDTLRRHGEAQEAYRAVLKAMPRHVAARNNLALSLAFTGKYDEALAIMVPLARSTAATQRIRENLALIYGLSGDRERSASLARMDLDEAAVAGNQEFFAWARTRQP